MVRGLSLSCRPQLGHHHVEDGDQKEGVGCEDQEDGADVDPLVVSGLHEGTVVQSLQVRK